MVLALHLAGGLWLDQDLRQNRQAARPVLADRDAMQAIVVHMQPGAEPAIPALPPLTVQAPTTGMATPLQTRPAGGPVVAVPEPAREDATAAHLFDANGRILMPASATSAQAPATAFRRGILDSHQRPNMPQSPITYTTTRFEQAWAPPDENLWQKAARKTTAVGNVLPLPGGYHVKCFISPLTLQLGCGVAGPEQMHAPLQVEYTRNNLPSATPLIKTHESQAPAPVAQSGSDGALGDMPGQDAVPARPSSAFFVSPVPAGNPGTSSQDDWVNPVRARQSRSGGDGH